MNYDVKFSDNFRRSAKILSKKYPSLKNDVLNLVSELSRKPDMGTSLGNNMFKVRMAISSKGRGKSAGARIITFVIYWHEEILLAEIYDKSEYSSVDESKILAILRKEGFDL